MIECKNIRIESKNKVILNSIDLDIKKGEKILIKGESGSGKTSLIRSLVFFAKFNGMIMYDGKEVGVGNIEQYRHRIGYIGQKIPDFNQTVEEFIKIQEGFNLNQKNISSIDIIKEYLNKLNFGSSILKSNFNILSGGEKQRIAVICTLLLNKPIYIFDEVTSALDQKNINALISLIMEDQNRTVISVSHNIEWEKYCIRIIKMENGGIIEDRLI